MKKISPITYDIDKDICAPCQIKKNKNNKDFKTCYSKDSLIKIANIWNIENKDKKKFQIKICQKKKFGNKFKKD